jgi:hypothetical protein
LLQSEKHANEQAVDKQVRKQTGGIPCMKFRIAGAIVLFIIVSLVLAIFLGDPAMMMKAFQSSGSGSPPVAPTSVPADANPIVKENAQPGSNEWRIPAGKEATTQIQAYAGAVSVDPGQSLQFYVSTQKAGTPYSIQIFRLGWYSGFGGRLLKLVQNQEGEAQGYYEERTRKLVACSTCYQGTDGLIEARWKPSYTLEVPQDWTSGVYLAKFTDASGWQTYAPFVVHGNPNSRYVVVTPDTTMAASNEWGGKSLYDMGSGFFSENSFAPTAAKVSFDRPYLYYAGASQVVSLELNAIRWMERQGYDLSYISNVDLHRQPQQLQRHKATISIGHDAYWTLEMRQGYEAARDKGVGLAFLGAADGVWQMRFEASSTGTPDRTVICYKVSSEENTLSRDPMYATDHTRVTAQWRDPVLHQPESTLIGVMYSDMSRGQVDFAWKVNKDADQTLLKNTGIQPGKGYGCSYVGYLWDRVYRDSSPANLKVLATSNVHNENNKEDVSNTTYYISQSGAMVFATGSTYWTYALDNYRPTYLPDRNWECGDTESPEMQALLANVFHELVERHSPNAL